MNARTYAAVAAMLLGIAAILASVGGPAAVASYHHAYEVFIRYGEAEGRAAWLPLTTDGMLLAALVVMYGRRWAQQRIGFVPWLAFVVGFVGTIAANLASADIVGAPTPGEAVGRLVAAVWAPVSFAVTLELSAVMLGRVRDYIARKRAAVDTTWPVTHYVGSLVPPPYVPVVPEPQRVVDPDPDPVGTWLRNPGPATVDAATRALEDATRRNPAPGDPATRPGSKRPTRPATRVVPPRATRDGERDDATVLEWIGSEWDRVGRPPTAKAVREYAGCGGSRATRLLGQARDVRPAVAPVPAPVEQVEADAS